MSNESVYGGRDVVGQFVDDQRGTGVVCSHQVSAEIIGGEVAGVVAHGLNFTEELKVFV
jgi:hypothetical protein